MNSFINLVGATFLGAIIAFVGLMYTSPETIDTAYCQITTDTVLEYNVCQVTHHTFK